MLFRSAMLLVIPDEVDGIATVASKLDSAEIRKILDNQASHNGTITMPKFKIATTIDADKNKSTFKSLGMVKAFNGDADFSGMIVPNEENGGLYIGAIIHKAVIEVDELGTKAAAATAVAMEKNSAPGEDFIDLRADHPFEFVLYHKGSGTILFSGQYYGD